METLAYLHLAQENEDPEAKELAIDHLRTPQKMAIGAVGVACAIGPLGLADVASAYSCYHSCYRPYYPIYRPVYYRVYRPVYYYYPRYSHYYPDCSYYCPSDDYYPVSPISSGHDYLQVGNDDSLSDGTYNEYTYLIQQALADLGYYSGALDGLYGPETAHAVAAFQTDYGLTVDGIAGPETIGALGVGADV